MKDQETSAFSKIRGSAGFTLVELSICLCIIGILMSGSILGGSQYFKVEKVRQTHRNIELVMNVLGAYAQTHYRLPCPADPKASAAQAGREEDNGKCFVPGGNTLAGIVPWKELAIPQNMAVDGWGRYIIYKPTPGLTVDTQSALLRDTAGTAPLDVHNACRSALWYDADGNHLNRAKALFCCNAPPAGNAMPAEDVVDAATAAAIEPAAGGRMDSAKDPAFNGSFSIPHYMDGPAAPLIRASVPAVVLASEGGPGGDIVSQQRSDQLFARVGGGSCEHPPAAMASSYSCQPQNFRSDSTGPAIKDPVSGAMIPVPPLYGVNLALTGDKYQLRAVLTKSSDDSAYDDSLGFYVINNDGSLGDVQMLIPSVKNWSKGETEDFSVSFDGTVRGIGLFVVPDGYNRMDGYKRVDLSKLKFISNYAQVNQKPASITDQAPPALVSVDPQTGADTTVTGAGGVSAYHLYGNLNPGHASHTLQNASICHVAGEKTGPNHDFTCLRPSALTEAGVNPAHPGLAQIGFEDRANINCYEFKNGTCQGLGNHTGNDLLSDGESGYVASIGDNTYDKVAFSIGVASCPQKQ